METLSIDLEIENIKHMKKSCFKKLGKEAVRTEAFLYLIRRKEQAI